MGVLLSEAKSELNRAVPGSPDREDIHLIMEYKTGEEWGIYKSPRANRFIIHSDSVNPMVSVVEEFQPLLQKFQPHLFVVGGLQMMDNFPFPEGKRRERLSKVREQMTSLTDETRIHFEMASFTDEQLVRELTQYVLPFADSLGMNEQELANLHHILMYGNISLVSDSNPRVAVVLDQMRHVFKLVRELGLSTPKSRPLTRLHVHTLAYQAIVTVAGSPWKNSQAAAAKASLTANRHVCGSSEVDVDKAMLIMDESFSTSAASTAQRVPLDANAPVSCWEERWPLDDSHLSAIGTPAESADVLQVQICVAPVLVCTEAQQTAGGGDNISSAGLVLQI
ncbi:ADP-dependent glucokinase [Gryllus bimaculatus]|nr:ADP-dependent glucokinase [Gryllus bimaculatus]